MTTKQVQCLLAYLGYDPGGIDGVDGQKTRQAIRNFQGAEGLGVDGVAGEATKLLIPLLTGTMRELNLQTLQTLRKSLENLDLTPEELKAP